MWIIYLYIIWSFLSLGAFVLLGSITRGCSCKFELIEDYLELKLEGRSWDILFFICLLSAFFNDLVPHSCMFVPICI